jgi:hypothetical protein
MRAPAASHGIMLVNPQQQQNRSAASTRRQCPNTQDQ